MTQHSLYLHENLGRHADAHFKEKEFARTGKCCLSEGPLWYIPNEHPCCLLLRGFGPLLSSLLSPPLSKCF